MPLKIEFELRGIDRMVGRNDSFAADLHEELYLALREQARETRGFWRAAAPVFSGALRKGIRTRSSRAKLTSQVKATAPHSWLVQHGRRPGPMPSVDPRRAKNPKSAQRLADWAKAHGIAPFVLARSIAKKGTKAHPFRAIGAAKHAFEQRVQAALDRVAAKYRTS